MNISHKVGPSCVQDCARIVLLSSIIMTAKLSNPREYQEIFHWAETQQDGAIPSFGLRKNDPYEVSLKQTDLVDRIVDIESQYQSGFDNR
jgi:hypothetical protein